MRVKVRYFLNKKELSKKAPKNLKSNLYLIVFLDQNYVPEKYMMSLWIFFLPPNMK